MAPPTRKLLEILPFESSWKKRFMKQFGKFDGNTNFLVHDIIMATWQSACLLRLEDKKKSQQLLNVWGRVANIPYAEEPDVTMIDRIIEDDLQHNRVYSYEVVSAAEELLRRITGVR